MRPAAGDDRPSVSMFFAVHASLVLLLGGCVPYPVERATVQGNEVSPSRAAALVPGQTTRQQVYSALGIPTAYWPEENIAVYQWTMLDAHWKVFDAMPLVFAIGDIASLSADIATGSIGEYDPLEALLDDRHDGSVYRQPLTYDFPLSRTGSTEYFLAVAFASDDRVATFTRVSGDPRQARGQLQDWTRTLIDSRSNSVSKGRHGRDDVHAMLGRPRYASRDAQVELYEWQHAGAQLLLLYDSDGRIIEKRVSNASGADWHRQAVALRKDALALRPASRADARDLFGTPQRARLDNSGEIYESDAGVIVAQVDYDDQGRVTSVQDAAGLGDDSMSGDAWRLFRRDDETSVHIHLRVQVGGKASPLFTVDSDGTTGPDRVGLFLDAAPGTAALGPRNLATRWCGSAEHLEGWIYFLVPPGSYRLRVATSDLRDAVAASLSSVSTWRLDVPLGQSDIYAGTLRIDARESVAKAGRPSYLYDLKTHFSAAEQSIAQLAAWKCDKGWTIGPAVPLQAHGQR